MHVMKPHTKKSEVTIANDARSPRPRSGAAEVAEGLNEPDRVAIYYHFLSNHFATVTSTSVRKVPCVPPLATGASTHKSQR